MASPSSRAHCNDDSQLLSSQEALRTTLCAGMGCVTSKHLRKQAIYDGWTSPPPPSRSVTRPMKMSSRYSIECHHHHSVSLTSTTYGSLKVESPKRSKVRLPSLNDMYGTLSAFDRGEPARCTIGVRSSRSSSPPQAVRSNYPRRDDPAVPALHASPFSDFIIDNYHNSQAISGGMDTVHSPQIHRVVESPAMHPQSSYRGSMSSAELGLPETINVNEMMIGLEEAAPLSKNSSPAKYNHSNTSTPRTKILQQYNKNLKRKAEDSQKTTDSCYVKKGAVASLKNCSKETAVYGKENTSPLQTQHITKCPSKKHILTESPVSKRSLSHVSNVSRALDLHVTETCSPAALSTSPQQATKKSVLSLKPSHNENIVARSRASETSRSFFYRQSDKSSPGTSSASMASARSVHHAPANGKAKLTLSTHQSDQSASLLHTPSPLPAVRSMSRRLVFATESTLSSNELTSPTFDPELVASYEKALSDVSQVEWNATHHLSPKRQGIYSAETLAADVGRPWCWSTISLPIAELDRRLYDPLECFDEKSPPGGANVVVLYTTTLRGIRKTFEDCNTTREILDSFNIIIDERDVSMHLEFLNELRELMGRVVSVPRLFVRGRYIGGIEMVIRLHEDGKLSELLEGLPKRLDGGTCDGCGGMRFVPCLECCGSCKIRCEDDHKVIRCPDCNENGLIQCPICS